MMMKMTWLILALCGLSAADKLILGTLGQRPKIPCGTDTSGKAFEWKQNGNSVHSKDPRSGMDRNGRLPVSKRAILKRDHLEISRLEEGDLGRYTCEVEGVVQQPSHRLFIMSVSASPPGVLQPGSKATLQCLVKGLESMPTLEWEKLDGGPRASGKDHVLNPVATTHAGSWECRFSQDGETYKQTLELEVRVQGPDNEHVTDRVAAPTLPASTTKSKTNCSNCTDTVVSETIGATEAPPGLLGGLSLWIWVAVGVGCFILFLLVGCLIALLQRNKRLRRRAWKQRTSSRQPLKPKQYCQCDRSTGAIDIMAPPPQRHSEKPSTRPPRQQP